MRKHALGILALTLFSLPKFALADVPLSFTHHGVLKEDGALVNGNRDIIATIYDEQGNIVGQNSDNVEVRSGLYNLTVNNIDVALLVAANKLLLKINVDGEDLKPALDITAVPYALAAKHADISDNVVCHGCITPDHLSFNALQDSALPNCQVNQVLRQADGSSWVCTDMVNLLPETATTLLNGKVGINTTDFSAGAFEYTIDQQNDGVRDIDPAIPACECLSGPGADDYLCDERFVTITDNGSICYDQVGPFYRLYNRGPYMVPLAGVVVVDEGNIGIGTGLPQAPIHLRAMNGAEKYEVIVADTQPEVLLEDLDGSNYAVSLNDGVLSVGRVDEEGVVTPAMTLDEHGLTVAGNIEAAGFGGDLKVTADDLSFNYAASDKKGGDASSIADGTVKTAKIVDKNVTKAKLSDDVQASLNKADSALQSIATGSVTKEMLDGSVRNSLDKADSALQKLVAGSINSEMIANGTITSDDLGIVWALGSSKGGNAKVADMANAIKDGTVSTNKIVDGNVTKAKLESGIQSSLAKADSALQSIGSGSITTSHILNATILNEDIAKGTIAKDRLVSTIQASLNLADSALQNDTGTVDSNNILDGTIVSIDMADNAVTTDKIKNSAVTPAKVSFNYAASSSQGGAASSIADNTVTSSKIVDGTITGADILDGTIQTADVGFNWALGSSKGGNAKVADLANSVAKNVIVGGISTSTSMIQQGTVTGWNILDGTIQTADVGFNWALGSTKGGNAAVADKANSVADNIISTAKIINGAVTSDKVNFNYAASSSKGGAASSIADNTVNSSKIVDGSIATADLADNAVTIGKLNKTDLLNFIYPVGSIYITMQYNNATQVQNALGGTWTQLPYGYTLWTTSSTTALNNNNNFISASLPNIEGYLTSMQAGNHLDINQDHPIVSNAFSQYGGSYNAWNPTGSTDAEAVTLKFSASNSNSIYGYASRNGYTNTVQPPAIKVYMYKRTN